MIKILADIYNYYGGIVSFSSELTSQGYNAYNLIKQDPIPWKTVSSTYHYIVGSLAFKGDSTDYACPVNSLVILGHSIPIGAVITLSIYTSLDLPPNQTYSFTNTSTLDFYNLDLTITSGFYYKLEVSNITAFILSITHLLVGNCWSPTRGIDANSYELCKVSSGKRHKLRNGGTFVQPSEVYKRQKITINEMNKTDIFSFIDITAKYGKSSSLFIYLLEGTLLSTIITYYGRLVEWSPATPSSISSNYKVSFTIEESK